MEIDSSFRVPLRIEEAWKVLLDVERIAPCLPGAVLEEIEGDEYRGTVKVKLGAITSEYGGSARFVEVDETAHRAVLQAQGRESRGHGRAVATVTAVLHPDTDGTNVSVRTNLQISGRVAQFGRGVLDDVAGKLLGQFAECLRHEIASGGSAHLSGDTTKKEDGLPGEADGWTAGEGDRDERERSTEGHVTPAGVRFLDGPENEPLDLMTVAAVPFVKRVAIVAGLIALVIYIVRRT